MIYLIKHLIPKKIPFFSLSDFNLPHIDWKIPSTMFTECHKNFIKFCFKNFFTQLNESHTHKSGNIVDIVLCNHMILDKI